MALSASVRSPFYPRDRLGSLMRPVLLLFALSILVLEFPGARERVMSPYSGIETRNLYVQNIHATGPNAGSGIRPGDELVAVNGERLRNRAHYQYLVDSNHAFTPHDYEVRRNGALLHATVHYTRQPRSLLLERAALLILALAFLVLGVWVYLRRPDTLGALFAANTTILAYFLTDRPTAAGALVQLAGEMAGDAIILVFPACLLHFFLRFPDRPARAGRRPGRVAWLYLPALLLALFSAVLSTRRYTLHAPLAMGETILLAASTAYFAVYVIASLVVFVRAYRRVPRAQKQKLRVVIAATVAGLTPFLATTLYASIRPEATAHGALMAELCLAFVPLGFAYAILKHGAIELNSVVRKSLFYALLTGLLVAGYYAVIHTVGAFLSRELELSEYVWMPVAVLVLAIAFAPLRTQVQRVVDRLFYRAEFVYKQEVIDFSRRISRATTHDEMLDMFLERCDALLHPASMAVYLANGDRRLNLARASGEPEDYPAVFNPDCFLGRYFTRYRTPLLAEFLDRSWERPQLDADSRAVLALPSLAVCVPIAAPGRLLGLAVLGQKRSGLVYGRADGELLETFAEQLALVIENTNLIQSMVEKERLKSEVMLAREIQQALLPSSPPRHRGIELLGQMVSSTEVGGDYFDYFPLDDERIVIAIGDVSGKGIPAAMLMASLQAVFKNRAIKGGLAPAALNQELNDYLIDHAKPGQFATFFCGVLDLARSTLTFSNAGQCPALLATRGFIDRLGNGGMVLGASRMHRFDEGRVGFAPGDLLFLYTDGVTEQTNSSGEEFGEERLIDFIHTNRNLPPVELQNALLATIAEFGGGRRDDDITSVIALRKTA
ncbi:MAG TPA: SpoIIE family protein phosphatase [Candidatus Krumholzibacteria bacterium]|nr:SpoIIE family protein phosphatase [Candidatus Krumholzibacteria bacterium]